MEEEFVVENEESENDSSENVESVNSDYSELLSDIKTEIIKTNDLIEYNNQINSYNVGVDFTFCLVFILFSICSLINLFFRNFWLCEIFSVILLSMIVFDKVVDYGDGIL